MPQIQIKEERPCRVAPFVQNPICGQGALKDVSHDARQVPITSVAKGNARGHDSQSLDLGPDA